jgi:hypothetical protein
MNKLFQCNINNRKYQVKSHRKRQVKTFVLGLSKKRMI